MKVLHVHNSYRELGGEDRLVTEQRRLLTGAGHSVIPLDTSNPQDPANAAASLLLSSWNPASAHHARTAALASKADLAHVHNTWFKLSASVIWALSRTIPVVITLHNYRLMCANGLLFRQGSICQLCVGGPPWSAIRYRCYRGSASQSLAAVLSGATHRRLHRNEVPFRVTVVSEFARDMMLDGGMPESLLEVHPNFVVDPGPRRSPSLSSTVLYVGRLSEEKGVRNLLEAWREWHPGDLRLLIVGDGPHGLGLRSGAPEGVLFTGALEQHEVRRLMMNSRALVFPSLVFEGQPMVVTEALAAGLPILATDNPSIKEIVSTGGWLVDTRNPHDFVAALEILRNDSFIDRVGHAARKRYVDRFTPELALARLEALYSSALDQA